MLPLVKGVFFAFFVALQATNDIKGHARAEQRDMYYDSQNKYEKAKYPLNLKYATPQVEHWGASAD